MIYAPRNATVIEFGLDPYIDRAYGYMAMALGLDYWTVPQISTHYVGNYSIDSNNAESLIRVLRHIAAKAEFVLPLALLRLVQSA